MTDAYDPYTHVRDVVTKLCKTHKIQDDKLNHDILIGGLVDGLGDGGDKIVGKWSKDFELGGVLYNTFTRRVLAEPETIINGFGEEILIVKTHYMCELFRIPMNTECTLANVLKLACYAAMLSFSLKKDDFPEGIVRAFKNMEMTSLFSYLTDMKTYLENVPDKETIDEAIVMMIEAIE